MPRHIETGHRMRCSAEGRWFEARKCSPASEVGELGNKAGPCEDSDKGWLWTGLGRCPQIPIVRLFAPSTALDRVGPFLFLRALFPGGPTFSRRPSAVPPQSPPLGLSPFPDLQVLKCPRTQSWHLVSFLIHSIGDFIQSKGSKYHLHAEGSSIYLFPTQTSLLNSQTYFQLPAPISI